MIATTLLLASTLVSGPEPQGVYVEARTASVYAGACHYGGQYTTDGREALMGWHFEAGQHGGVALAGVDLVVAVSADKNLAEKDAKRRSIVYVDADAQPAARQAALAWLKAKQAKLVGEIVAVKPGQVDVGSKKDDFWLAAGKAVAVKGSAMPERECCKMSYNVWYEPFAEVEKPLVGNVAVFRNADKDLGQVWERTGENEAFFGRFGPVKKPSGCCKARS